MYRDYYQTDIENENENESLEELNDKVTIGFDPEFDHDNFDFQELNLNYDHTEEIEDIIDEKIFKYKYRIANTDPENYFRRMDRVAARSIERATRRDPKVEANLHLLLDKETW